MAQQLCCRGMCKNLLRSDGQQQNHSKAKFPSNLNYGQKIVSETGPSMHKCMKIAQFIHIPLWRLAVILALGLVLCGHYLGHCWPRSMSVWYGVIRAQWVNSLAPGKFEWNFKYIIFKGILVIDGWGSCCEMALVWMSLDFTDDQSALVQVMAWCRQATSHYLSQCWPWSLSQYGVTRPQWVKITAISLSGWWVDVGFLAATQQL